MSLYIIYIAKLQTRKAISCRTKVNKYWMLILLFKCKNYMEYTSELNIYCNHSKWFMVDYYLPRQLRYITHDNVVYQRSNTRPAVYGVQTRIVDDSWCIGSGADGLRTAASSPVSIMHMFRNNVLNVSVEVWHQLMLEMMIQRASQI